MATKHKRDLQRLKALTPILHTDQPGLRALFPKTACKHSGRMRVSLARELIRTYAFYASKSVVADPMTGTGVTGVAAAICFLKGFYGCELIEHDAVGANEAIQNAVAVRRRPLGQATPAFWWEVHDGDSAEIKFPKIKPFDLLLTSPPFPNSHSQGISEMQSSIRDAKQLYAGTDFVCSSNWGLGASPDKTKWIFQLARVMKPWIRKTKVGGIILIHVKNYVRDRKEVRVDLWVKKALRRLRIVDVLGYHPVPLAYRSYFQECARYHKREILSRWEDESAGNWIEFLACGHIKTRDKKKQGRELPKRAVCMACGLKSGHVEIREERIIVGKRKATHVR